MEKKKDGVVKECLERATKIRKIESVLDDERKMVAKLLKELEKMRGDMEQLQEKVEVTNCASGSSTILSRGTSVLLPVTKEFSVNERNTLGRIVRGELFKKYKVTNKKSFESGEIQKHCHAQLGPSYLEDDEMFAYKESFVKLVNYELGQKRSLVNKRLLDAWTGKYIWRG
jgi:NAD+--asparagine ADP-ribosyltransferase